MSEPLPTIRKIPAAVVQVMASPQNSQPYPNESTGWRYENGVTR
jgi:hypothetical protein